MPEREVDKPFMMPIEDVFSISGRGTVVTGRIERGKVKVGEEIEIVGFKPTEKKVVTGRRDVPQAAGRRGGGGQRRGAAARGGKDGRGARAGAGQAGVDQAAHEVQGRGLHPVEGRGRAAHAVLQRLPAAVLHPDDGRDGVAEAAGGRRDGDAGRQHDDHGRAASRRWRSRRARASRFARAAARSARAPSREIFE